MRVCSICQLAHDESIPCARSTCTPEIDGYRIDKLLSAGTHNETYRGYESASGRSCLITLVTTSDSAAEKFLADAEIASAIFHPAIADVYDAGRIDDGRCYVVAEDVDGRTLRDVLDNANAPDVLTSVEIVRQVAEALHSLHQKGLIHRAIKPDNVILSTNADGVAARIQNIDLGGVASASMVSDKFAIESHLDALRYFAPEQFDNAEANAWTDVYSLGVVFFEMLSGAPPFQAKKAAALIEQHWNQIPREIAVDRFELRALVSHALNESLHKRPEARQSSADLFARQMRHIQQLATHSSIPPAAGTVSPRASRRAAIPPFTPAAAPVPTPVPEPVKKQRFIDTSGVSIEDWERGRTSGDLVRMEDVSPVAPNPVVADPTIDHQSPVEPIERREPRRSKLKNLKKRINAISERVAAETRRIGIEASSRLETLRPTKIDSEARAERSRAPRRIEWVQPEDDIPTVADVEAALRQEPRIITSNAQSLEAKLEVAPVVARVEPAPVVIESEVQKPIEAPAPLVIEPEVQKPIEAPVQIPEPRRSAVDEQPKKIYTPVIRKKSKRAKRSEIAPVIASAPLPSPPLEPAPKVQRVRTVTNIKPVSPAIMDAIRAAARSNTVESVAVASFPIVLDQDPEEITLVRAPRNRVTIDIDRAIRTSTSRLSSADLQFTPTIIGGRKRAPKADAMLTSDMFAADYVSRGTTASLPYKPAAVAVGVIGVIAFFLFGVSSLREVLQSSSPADSVVTQASVRTETTSTAVPVRTSSKPDAISKSIVPVKAVASVASKTAIDKETEPSVKDRPANRNRKDDEVKADKKISTTKAAPEKKVVEKKTPVTPKIDPGTRPRIVKNPKP